MVSKAILKLLVGQSVLVPLTTLLAQPFDSKVICNQIVYCLISDALSIATTYAALFVNSVENLGN